MARSLSSRSSLDALRVEARRWHKEIIAGDPDAIARFRRSFPDHAGAPKLRQAQHALAREYGFPSWAALKQEMEDRTRSSAERVHLLLDKSVNRYSTDPVTRRWGSYERDGLERGALAARLLKRHPEIARDSIHTAVVAHDLDAVRNFLRRDPSLARDRCAFDGWTPLLRLAYARLPIEEAFTNALAIATLLLDAGADPNAGWSEETPEFTPVVGVIGGGEAGQAAHPIAEAFARLLIARGADPFAPQGLYNTSLGPDSAFWLELLWSESEKRGETCKWTGPAPDALGGAGIPNALAYLLGNAVPHHGERARWLLEHGADARGINCYSRQPVIKHALLAGREDMAALLVGYGAVRPNLSEEEGFLAATLASDLAAMRRLGLAHPEYLERHDAMFAAIEAHQADAACALLALGMSPDVGDSKNFRALHHAADCGATEIARLLMGRGAEIDPVETRHGATPLGHALYHGRPEMVQLLAPQSRDFRTLCSAGAVDRLRELLSENPAWANRENRPGEPGLFFLPEDEEKAIEVAELLLSFGADPSVRNSSGQTPAQAARRRGLDDAATLLEEVASPD